MSYSHFSGTWFPTKLVLERTNAQKAWKQGKVAEDRARGIRYFLIRKWFGLGRLRTWEEAEKAYNSAGQYSRFELIDSDLDQLNELALQAAAAGQQEVFVGSMSIRYMITVEKMEELYKQLKV